MGKHKITYVAWALVLMLALTPVSSIATWTFGASNVSALGEEVVEVSDATELYNAMLAGGSVKLAQDIDAWFWLDVPNDTTLDLNGHNITFARSADFEYYDYYANNYYGGVDLHLRVYNGATLTITGGGKIENETGSNGPVVWAYDGGKVILESGTIAAVNYAMWLSYNGGDAGGELEMNGGNVVSSNDYAIVAYKNAKATINDGSISAKYSCLSGNGSTGNEGARFYINGGTLVSEGWAIYEPQADGVVEINGGEINAVITGVEVRSGDLAVTGGEIVVNGETEYKVVPSGNGTTTYGAAVAVAQHTTRNPINVNISGGTFTAPVAFSEANPQEGDAVDVNLAVVGGTFNATDDAVKSEDATGFVTGGKYSKNLDVKYVAEGYVPVYDFEDGSYEVISPAELDPADEIDTFVDEETGEEVYYVAPKAVDYGEWWIEDGGGDEGHVSVTVEFGKEFFADRKATLSAVEVSVDGLALDGEKGGELIGAMDIDMLNRDGDRIEVKDNELTIYIDLDEETYAKLAAYDKLYAVYFEDGVEVERYEIYLSDVEEGYWLYFMTPHLSTYGVVGVNEEAAEEAGTPDTGTVTAAGASASAAALVTAIAVGFLTSAISFVYLMRRRG